MTYGWAILIIAVVIAVLFDLGIFSSPSFGNSCITQDGFYCSNPILTSSGALYVNFAQFSSGQMNITGFGCSNSTAAPAYFQDNFIDLQPNEQSHVMFPCPTTSGASGTQFIGTLWVKYNTPQVTNVEEEVASIKAHVAVAQQYYISGYLSGQYIYSQQSGLLSDTNIGDHGTPPFFPLNGSLMYQLHYWSGDFIVTSLSGTTLLDMPLVGATGQNMAQSTGYSNGAQYLYLVSSDYGCGSVCSYLFKITTSGYNLMGNTLLPGGSWAYFTANDSKNVYLVDGSTISVVNKDTMAIETSVSGCAAPDGITLQPDGQYVWVACINSGDVFRINTQTYNAVQINVYSGGGIIASPDNKFVYTDAGSDIFGINTSTLQVTRTIPVPTGRGVVLAMSQDSSTMFAGTTGTIYVINLQAGTYNTIPISCNSCQIGAMTITPNGKELLVSEYNTNSGGNGVLYVINTQTDAVESTISLPEWVGEYMVMRPI